MQPRGLLLSSSGLLCRPHPRGPEARAGLGGRDRGPGLIRGQLVPLVFGVHVCVCSVRMLTCCLCHFSVSFEVGDGRRQPGRVRLALLGLV